VLIHIFDLHQRGSGAAIPSRSNEGRRFRVQDADGELTPILKRPGKLKTSQGGNREVKSSTIEHVARGRRLTGEQLVRL
jgi:hypothetical protein